MGEDGVITRRDQGVSLLLGLVAMAVAWVAYDIEPFPWLLLVGAVVSGIYEFYLFQRRLT